MLSVKSSLLNLLQYAICLSKVTYLSLPKQNDLLPQLPSPLFLTGDFNAKSAAGSSRTESRSQTVKSFIELNNPFIYNDDRPTYVDAR